MKKLLTISGLITALLLSATPVAHAQNQTANQLELCKALLSADQQERQTAAQALVGQRGALVNELIRMLQAQRKPDTRFGSSFHEIIIVLGSLRVKGATASLVSLVDTRLTGQPPLGGFGGRQIYYPAAQALIEINDPNATQWLFRRLAAPASEELIRVITWVLVQMHSEKVVRWMIKDELETLTAVLKRIGVSNTNPEKKNLERVMHLLDSKDELLPPENFVKNGAKN